MKIQYFLFLLILSAFLLFPGCKQKKANNSADSAFSSSSTENKEVNSPQTLQPGQSVQPAEPASAEQKTGTVPRVNIAYDISKFKATADQKAPAAHKKYLADPVAFMQLPAYSNWKETAVVGNETTLFYPGARIVKTADLKNLVNGIPLPLGTLLPVKGKITNSDPAYGDLFMFEDHYNYFYKTEWQGKEGLVFGADLYGTGNSPEHNLINALYYQQNARFSAFPPFTGYRMLAAQEKARIEKERIAFQEVRFTEYSLSLDNPDDMIALYKKDAGNTPLPLFITTDLVAHGLHLFFGKYLQQIEEQFFFPRLKALINNYLAQIAELTDQYGAGAQIESDKYAHTLHYAKTYFQIAEALLAMAPQVTEAVDESGMPGKVYQDVNQEQVLAAFPSMVQEEVNLMLKAEGHAISPNFEYNEDYSQYKPRGHYTKNGILQAYFRSMMWFGRLHLYISISDQIVRYPRNEAEARQGTALELSKDLFPIAALITEISINNPGLYADWQQLFDPITALIGMSDDLSFYDLIPFWKSLGIKDFSAWLKKEENITGALHKADQELRPPLISGNSVFFAPSGEGIKPPMGWRLFGQRFTYDSAIHQAVSPPRFLPRDIVRGIDIMKVFGSGTAEQFLQKSDYTELHELKPILDKLQQEFITMSPGIWTETYYNLVLFMIKAQAVFEPGAGFYFTESPAWGIKSQLAAHGTWAALRHDTILYVKQVYGERAGGEDWQPTFRTLPLPQPVHYIEPNIPFFQGSLAAITKLATIARNYRLENEIFDTRVSAWIEMLTRSLYIVEMEYDDQDVPGEDVLWIKTIPAQIAKLVVPPDAGYSSFMDNTDALKGAIIADVYTNAELMLALEVGIGIPYRLYVALNDNQGGKRIAVGYTFSYYEFTVPMDSRMTNEEWRKMVYVKTPALSDNLPFWAKGIALEARP